MVDIGIVGDYPFVALASPIIAGFIAWLLWRSWIPRSLVDLQVAFKTDDHEFEVHTVTRNIEDANALLDHPRARLGTSLYVMSLVGVFIIILEFTLAYIGLYGGLIAGNMAIALMLIFVPAVVSAAFALTAQISPPKTAMRATMQDESTKRRGLITVIAILWILALGILQLVLNNMMKLDTKDITSIVLFCLLLPAVVAYGRVLGSSWLPLFRSNWTLSKGESSQLHPHKPTPVKQGVAFLVAITAFTMPITAINTLVTLVLMFLFPDMFAHSNRVLELPEYTEQAVVMEEGGIIGFLAIELFSFIPIEEIRMPLVTSVLLFLLLNVALIGVAFVYDVARILFLGVSDAGGRGGIKVAESRLLRSEKRHQARVLNFCFSAFAGQSIFLLFLALITFWDSSFLPGGATCGPWENSICAIIEKDAMEQLTWMLAAGGQISFLAVWLASRSMWENYNKTHFDATADTERTEMSAWEDVIFLQRTPLATLLANDDWNGIVKRWQTHTSGPEGLTTVRKAQDEMMLQAAIGNWDEAEQLALSVLALKGGQAKGARIVLAAASVAQRDFKEAKPRIEMLRGQSQQAMHLEWIAEIIDPETIEFDADTLPMLALSPLARLNKDLLQRWADWEPWSEIEHRNDPIGKKFLLGDVARMRIVGRSQEALDRLEFWMHKNEITDWVMGDVARALLLVDTGMPLSSRNIRRDLSAKHPHHIAVRALQAHLLKHGIEEQPIEVMDGSEFDWPVNDGTRKPIEMQMAWLSRYNLVPYEGEYDEACGVHMMDGNSWLMYKSSEKVGIHPSAVKSRIWSKAAGWPKLGEIPAGNHLLMSGLIANVNGVPMDMGLPTMINLEDPRVRLVLELDD